MQALSQLSYTPTANLKLYGAAARQTAAQSTASDAPRRSRYDRASVATRVAPTPLAMPLPDRPTRLRSSTSPIASSSSPARPAASARRSRAPAPRAARRSSCTAASCASSRRSTTRSSRRGAPRADDPAARSREGDGRRFRQRRERAAKRSSGASTRSCTPPRCWASLGPIEHQSFDSWLALLRVNLAAPMGLTRALMPLLSTRARRERRVHARRPRRAAARLLGRLRRDQGRASRRSRASSPTSGRTARNLRVNAVVPGPIRSPLRGADASRRGPRRSCRRRRRWCRSTCTSSPGRPRPRAARSIDAQAWLARRVLPSSPLRA